MKKEIQEFIFEEIVNTSLRIRAPATVNVLNSFATFLVRRGTDELRADEIAEKQENLIGRVLMDVTEEWDALGIPSPIGCSEDKNIWLTWRHPKYLQLTGRWPLKQKYIRVLNWLSSLDARGYLLPGVLFLKILRCNPIFVTDGPNDEGVDCIGRIADGPLRSVVVFLQVKTRQGSQGRMGRDIILQEYGKYLILEKTRKYRDYLNALRFDEIRDGSTNIYMIISNVEFDPRGRQIAKDLGVVVRSRRQMAQFLSTHFTMKGLADARRKVAIPDTPDLRTNIAPELSLFVRRGSRR